MSGLAVSSLGFFIVHSAVTKTIQPLGLFFLGTDMLWSGIDMGIQIQRENNPDASRFSFSPAVGVVVRIQL